MTNQAVAPMRSRFCAAFPILYHGTSTASLRDIYEKGILPRGGGAKNNWAHTVGSNKQTVYLTDAYASYFAFSAEQGKEGGAVLEIDTALLDPDCFVPDEDFLEQATRGMRIPHTPGWLKDCKDMKRRTIWYREHAHWFLPEVSLQGLGTVGYRGRIPFTAVKRTAFFDHELLMEASLIFDPTISTLNYKILGERYRATCRSIFDPPDIATETETSTEEAKMIGRLTGKSILAINSVRSLSRLPLVETNPLYGEGA